MSREVGTGEQMGQVIGKGEKVRGQSRVDGWGGGGMATKGPGDEGMEGRDRGTNCDISKLFSDE